MYIYHHFYFFIIIIIIIFFGGGGGGGGGGVRNFNIYGEGGFCGYFLNGSFLCIYRGFLKFKVQNGNTLCRYLNLKYFLGMPDIPDIFWCGGGGVYSRCLV